jgi:hypothetical protein
VKAGASSAVFPIVPGKENLDADFYAFLIENTASNISVMYDVGSRKDPLNFAPAIAQYFESGEFVIPVDKDIPTQLTEGGVALESIATVIWRYGPAILPTFIELNDPHSHADFDHVGEC